MRFKTYLNERRKRYFNMPIEKVKKLADPNVSMDKMRKQESYYIDKIKKLILSGNLDDPIEITVKDEKPYKIFDGMHRLVAYEELGYDKIPVKFVDEYGNPLGKIY